MAYRLLRRYEMLFKGVPYLHRRSNQGDFVAAELLEDLVTNKLSAPINERVASQRLVLNTKNTRVGVKARRGDGTFGECVPNARTVTDAGFQVARGPIATIEIGVEVKILAQAMGKQIDRVVNDLAKQVEHFKAKGGSPICVAVVGINQADHYQSFEGDRVWTTDGKLRPHPAQQAAEAEKRLLALAAPEYEEFLILRFMATNEEPYPFEWVNQSQTELEYGAVLTRIARAYDARFAHRG